MRRANQHARIKREPGFQQPMPNSGLARIDEDDNSTVAHSEVERRMQRSDARKSSPDRLTDFSLMIEN